MPAVGATTSQPHAGIRTYRSRRPSASSSVDSRNVSSAGATWSSIVVRGLLGNGSWDRRHGHLRKLPEFDIGLRLIVTDVA
jgi:hypothetical protein